VRRLILSVVLVAVALAAQLTIVNRLSLPGGAGPDLVLLVVVALALTGGPLAGMLTGFLAGLALDIAPPAGHTVGEYALVLCIVGYACGRLSGLGEESPTLYVAISAGAAAVGAVLYAALGIMLSDPQVTWASVQHVLPPVVVYNVLLSPFVLFGVVKLYSWAGGSASQEAPSAGFSSPAAGALGAAGLAAGALRQSGSSGAPKLHLGERRSGDGWLAGARTSSVTRPAGLSTAQREPRLRLSGQRSSGGSASGLGVSGARYSAPRAIPRVHFRSRRSSFAGSSGTGAPRSGAVPRFRKRNVTATIGTGGALNRVTPRRGTFGRSRSFGKGATLGLGGRSRLGGPSTVGGPSKLGGRTKLGGRRKFGRRSSRSSLGGRSSLRARKGLRSSAPRLKMRRHTWRARLGRLLGRNRGGFR
jgi:rod shape-determining protein MreD